MEAGHIISLTCECHAPHGLVDNVAHLLYIMVNGLGLKVVLCRLIAIP